jgi:hypothetical protein
MKVGDHVRIVGIPPNLPVDDEFKTPEIFRLCVGRVFPIPAIQQVEGLGHPMIGLDVGEVLGMESYRETIYVEPSCLKLVKRLALRQLLQNFVPQFLRFAEKLLVFEKQTV